MKEIHKSPRLYTGQDLNPQSPVALSLPQAHYLKSVLRAETGDKIRLFNGRDGEWIATLETLGKKSGLAALEMQHKAQPPKRAPLHLLFAPIKKNRMDFLIEKAVELGVTDLHPVITTRTEVRKLKLERMQAQIIEAAEQCERLDLPTLHEPQALDKKMNGWDSAIEILWAAERIETAPNITKIKAPKAFLIGPEGGFDENEICALEKLDFIRPISLGSEILRAETAALYCLSHAKK